MARAVLHPTFSDDSGPLPGLNLPKLPLEIAGSKHVHGECGHLMEDDTVSLPVSLVVVVVVMEVIGKGEVHLDPMGLLPSTSSTSISTVVLLGYLWHAPPHAILRHGR